MTNIDKQYVLEQVNPCLNTLNEISYEEFDELFTGMSAEELCEIKNVLSRHHINYVEKKSNNFPKNNYLSKHRTIREIRSMKDISNEQLCLMYQNSDMDAGDILVRKNVGFIKEIVDKERNKYKCSDLEFDDAFNEGVMGLIEAANRFDNSRECKLVTYSGFWIRQRIGRAIANLGYTIRIPIHIFEKLKVIKNCRKKHPKADLKQLLKILENENGLVLSEQKFIEYNALIERCLNVVSLNEIVGYCEEPRSELIGFVAGNTLSAEDAAAKRLCRNDINKLLSGLKEREALVIQKRFGLNDGYEMTLEEIGKELNVTRERVRQIEANALSKLRLPSFSNKIRDYYYN